jgi:hypothetical protein
VILQERAAFGVGFVRGVCPDGTSRSSGPHFQQRSVRGRGLTTLINRTFPRPILVGMAKQPPKPQAPTIWTIYKAAANLRPLGIVEPSDEDEAIEKAAKRVQGAPAMTLISISLAVPPIYAAARTTTYLAEPHNDAYARAMQIPMNPKQILRLPQNEEICSPVVSRNCQPISGSATLYPLKNMRAADGNSWW